DGLPGVDRQLAEIAARRDGRVGPVAAGAVDEHGERPPLLRDRLARLHERRPVLGVALLEEGAAAGLLDGAHALIATLRVAPDDDDAGAGAGQRIGHATA